MTKEEQSSGILMNLSDELDIPDSHYEKAIARYESFGNHLHRRESGVLIYNPEYSPQGSFTLGTVTRSPSGQRPCYDLDSVAELTSLSKGRATQAMIKELLGVEVKAYATQNGIKRPVSEGKRCWTIEYSDGDVDFHIDVLPAIPEDLATKRMLTIMWGVAEHLASRAVAISDHRDPNYGRISSTWPSSNPRGYAAWFKEMMKPAGRRLLAERRITASIETVPTYQWKTPLQRGVQILKRHRDIHFSHDPENKPASIIVTTLAALCYKNELDLTEALRAIIYGMRGKIENRGGILWIPNPVNPLENFADRWRGRPEMITKCYQWLWKLQADFEELMESSSIPIVGNILKASFGDDVGKGTLMRMGTGIAQDRAAGNLRIMPTGLLGATGRLVKDHTFYGQSQD